MLCDFGSSTLDCTCFGESSYKVGTERWDAPEFYAGDEYVPRTKQSDIWALGCVAIEVSLSHRDPFIFEMGLSLKDDVVNIF
jgi:serine/threonine protein kinase